MLRKALLNITFKLRPEWRDEEQKQTNKKNKQKPRQGTCSKDLRKEEVVVPVKVAGVSNMWHEDWRDKKVTS